METAGSLLYCTLMIPMDVFRSYGIKRWSKLLQRREADL